MTADLAIARLRELPTDARAIVIDNSPDGSQVALLRESSGQAIILHTENRGFGAAVNVALKHCSPGWVLLLNPDASLSELALRTLRQVADDRAIDLAAPVILNSNTGRVWYAGARLEPFTMRCIHRGFGQQLETLSLTKPVTTTDVVSGCILLLSPNARRTVLPLREDLFMYWEDVDLSLRARSAKLTLGVVPASVGSHSKRTHRSLLFYEYNARNRLLVARTQSRYTWWAALVTTPIIVAREILWIVRHENQRWQCTRSVVRGLTSGIKSPG